MRRLSIFIVTLISLILMGAPAAFAAAPSAQNDRTGWQPFEVVGFNPCYPEDVAITVQALFELKVMEDGSGGLHTVIQSQLRGTGVGSVTGAKYVVRDTAVYTETATTAGVVTFGVPITGMMISLDRDVPDLYYIIHFHLTFNAKGELTSEVGKFEFLCR
ncbi:hypothetical protein D3880_22310 [Pseudomonas cavernae]|uniref:DUF4426 domain-containing protein n=1 Tax=Pseudomonas cavernae TaxID=2320867 RepID=A0A385Z708_9PSED|nr:hypothetical protein [Pseudomonas cavernae]AYC34936.1 hypothetical protein D3880_22310 [Pseudomonas cavernae]